MSNVSPEQIAAPVQQETAPAASTGTMDRKSELKAKLQAVMDAASNRQGGVTTEVLQEPAPVEQSAPPEPEVNKEPDPSPSQPSLESNPEYVELLKQNRELLAKQKELEEKERLLSEAEEAKKIKDRLAAKDYDALEEMGLSLEEWSERVLESDTDRHTRALERKMEKMMSKLEQFEKMEQERIENQRSSQQQKAVQEFRESIDKTIGESDEFKLLKLANLGGEVFNVISNHAQKTQELRGQPEILDISEAARQVMKYYKPQFRNLVEGIKDMEDFRDLFGGAPAPTPAAPAHESPKTLLSREVKQSPSVGSTTRPKTKQEFLQWAAQKLEGLQQE